MSEGGRRDLRRQQIPIRQPFPHHPRGQIPHLFLGVKVADVVPACDLVDVAVEILRRGVAIGVPNGSFRLGIERFRSVDMGAVSDVFPLVVFYDFVSLRQSQIGPELVGVQGALWVPVLLYEGAQGLALPVRDHLDSHPAGFPAVCYDPDIHALLPVAAEFLVAVPVFIDSAVKGFVYFKRPAVEAFLFRPGFADALQHEQGGFMGYPDYAGKLTGVDSCRVGSVQVEGGGPFLQGERGVGHCGSDADAEVLSTIPAVIGLGLAIGTLSDAAAASAVRAIYGFGQAVYFLSPSVFFEPFFRRYILRQFNR